MGVVVDVMQVRDHASPLHTLLYLLASCLPLSTIREGGEVICCSNQRCSGLEGCSRVVSWFKIVISSQVHRVYI